MDIAPDKDRINPSRSELVRNFTRLPQRNNRKKPAICVSQSVNNRTQSRPTFLLVSPTLYPRDISVRIPNPCNDPLTPFHVERYSLHKCLTVYLLSSVSGEKHLDTCIISIVVVVVVVGRELESSE